MKYIYTFLLMAVVALPAQAQIIDSLPPMYQFWESDIGVRPSFDLSQTPTNRFDANGDGVAELVYADFNENGVAVRLNIKHVLLDSLLFTLDLDALRTQLVADGFEQGDLAQIMFETFMHWVPREGAQIGVDPFLMTAGNGPIIIDPNGFNIGMPPSIFRYFATTDFDEDGWPEIIVGNKKEKRVQVFGSKFAPNNQ